ncbi:unnamed protein product [Caenorhabditis bovis]|uniref:SAM domain-containing protein n=1 Tax=Caenorhabditis bovis TaxID=2654633 RepID=A0A8S1E9D5_9PELO|nr:unnamed protein product [Caenorhabditis bovis]
MEAWAQFFRRAGIPNDLSVKYAKSFQQNRITKEMLPDLDKSTLVELGVTAIGDQISILKRIKAASNAITKDEQEEETLEDIPKKPKAKITAPGESSSYGSELRRGKPPPDRHEIYHVKMPLGLTPRSQQILEKAKQMRSQGMTVRGTTGVRQGGRSVSPVDKTSLAARLSKKETSGSVAEVSSSTDKLLRRLKIQGKHDDKTNKIQKISTSGIQKKTIRNNSSLATVKIHVKPQVKSFHKNKIIVKTAKKSVHDRIQIRTDEDDIYDEEMIVDDDDGDDVVLDYEDEEMYDDYNDDETLEVPSSSGIRQRITYASSSNPRHRSVNSNRIATVIDESDSVFNRVSFHRR